MQAGTKQFNDFLIMKALQAKVADFVIYSKFHARSDKALKLCLIQKDFLIMEPLPARVADFMIY